MTSTRLAWQPSCTLVSLWHLDTRESFTFLLIYFFPFFFFLHHDCTNIPMTRTPVSSATRLTVHTTSVAAPPGWSVRCRDAGVQTGTTSGDAHAATRGLTPADSSTLFTFFSFSCCLSLPPSLPFFFLKSALYLSPFLSKRKKKRLKSPLLSSRYRVNAFHPLYIFGKLRKKKKTS